MAAGAREGFARRVDASTTKLRETRVPLLPRLLLLAGIATSFIVALFVFKLRGTMGPDTGARFLLLRNLIEHHQISFGGLTDPVARELDAFAGYRAYAGGDAFVVYPVVFPALTAVLYSAFGDLGLVLLPMAAAGLAAWTVFRTAQRLGLAGTNAVPAVLLFGSPLLVYAATFWDHSCIIALSATATALVVRSYGDGARPRTLAWAGVVCGAGLWIHELMLLLGMSFGVALASDASVRRRAWPFFAGLGSTVAAWAVANQWLYGTPRGPHLLGPLDPTEPFKLQQLISSHAFFGRLVAELAGDAGVFDVALAVLVVGTVVASLVSRRAAMAGAALIVVIGLVKLTDGAVASGLFQAMPWLALALIGGKSELGARRAFSTLRRAAVCFGVSTMLTPITPGLNWGSRYLLTLLPSLTLLALRGYEEVLATLGKDRARSAAPAIVAFLAAGALVGVTRELRFYSNKASFDRSHARAVARLDREILATDLWWLSSELVVYDVTPRISLVVNVPGSDQLPPSVPLAERTPRVREAFFAKLAEMGEARFSFVGTDAGRVSLLSAATAQGFREVERTTERDLIVARFAKEP